MSLRYVTRAQWGARPFRPGGNRFTPPITGVTIHWEGPAVGTRTHDRCPALVRQIQAFHMDSRGWTDIAYNLAVCPHGYVFEGRGRDRGNGANGDDSNATRYSVCALVGTGDPQPASLLAGLADAVNLARSWGAGPSVDGHRDHQSTLCPGDDLYRWVKAGVPVPKPPTKGTADVKLTDPVAGTERLNDGKPLTVAQCLARGAYAYAQVIEKGSVDRRLDADDAGDASLELRVRRLEAKAAEQ
jgi:hypothetical protein